MTKRRTIGMALLALMLAAATKAQERGKARSDERRSLVAREESRQGQKSDPAKEDSTYLIGPGDVLDISVWKELDFSRAVQVRPDGKISLPLLNDVQASGVTPIQLAATLAAMLRKYVTQPQVTVIVTQINSRIVYVLGEVNRPGALPLLPRMTVLEALASAGGFTPFAKEKKIYVLRNESGKQNRYPFNYREAIRGGGPQRDFTLEPGDTIVVP